MASIFGMNNFEISGSGPMTMSTQFKLMCRFCPLSDSAIWGRRLTSKICVAVGISTGIIVIVLVVAYSDLIRNLFWLAYRYLITLVLVKTPVYNRVYLNMNGRSAAMTRKIDDQIRKIKLDAKKEKQKRTAERYRKRLEDQNRNEEEQAKKNKAVSNDSTTDGQQNRAADQGRPATGTSGPPPPRVTLMHAMTAPGPDHEESVDSSGQTRPWLKRSGKRYTSPARLESGQFWNTNSGTDATA